MFERCGVIKEEADEDFDGVNFARSTRRYYTADRVLA
jgi:hypothetical protein